MTAAGDRLLAVAIAAALLISAALSSPLLPVSPRLGIAPQDQKYFSAAVIACRDGSKSFPRDRLNDGYCDCPDGTDEPGTSACPESKFYCLNIGDISRTVFSSRVNDHICDCCDGSDEYDGGINCPNTCHKKANALLNNSNANGSAKVKLDYTSMREKKSRVDMEDLFQKLKGLRVVIMIELVCAICMFCFCFNYRRIRSRRRHHLLRS